MARRPDESEEARRLREAGLLEELLDLLDADAVVMVVLREPEGGEDKRTAVSKNAVLSFARLLPGPFSMAMCMAVGDACLEVIACAADVMGAAHDTIDWKEPR